VHIRVCSGRVNSGGTVNYAGTGFLIAGLFVIGSVLGSRAVPAETPDADIKAAIEELKQGQAEIRKDIAEILKRMPAPPPPAIEKLAKPVSLGSLAPRGRSDAPLTIIEFSDYQCPYCKRHVDQTLPKLLADYVDTGKARYAFRDYPLEQIHPLAAKAAEAARCAGDQGRYWEMHDRLFANQKELEPEKLPTHATALKLDEAAFRACLDGSRNAARVKEDLQAGEELGARGTPMFVVGPTGGNLVTSGVIIHGAQPIAVFKSEIEKLLALPPLASN
jgi:protein-disulfide isomerase